MATSRSICSRETQTPRPDTPQTLHRPYWDRLALLGFFEPDDPPCADVLVLVLAPHEPEVAVDGVCLPAQDDPEAALEAVRVLHVVSEFSGESFPQRFMLAFHDRQHIGSVDLLVAELLMPREKEPGPLLCLGVGEVFTMRVPGWDADRAARIVADGYNRIGRGYLEWWEKDASPTRQRYLDRLLGLLRPGSRVLDLGFGPGLPVLDTVTAAGHRAIGVDVSAAQLALAREQVPDARLLRADMAALHFAPHVFDAVVAFYSVTHVPRDRHMGLLARIREWLVPGGVLVANMGAFDSADFIEDGWLGVPMFFSQYDADENDRMIARCGLDMVEAEIVAEDEDGAPVSFLWLVARRPSTA